MFAMLKSRRDKLNDASNEFFKLVSDVVDVYGSDKPERAEINRRDDTTVEVRLFKKKSGELLFRRIFSNDYTSEIRIHLLGGDDVASVEGNGRSGILVRILGGEGHDEFVDNSNVSGTIFYDDASITKSNRATSSEIEFDKPDSNKEVIEPMLEDRYRIWRTLPLVSLNSDDGIILGATSSITQHAFRADPYSYSFTMNARYAPKVKHYDVQLHADSYTMIDKARAEIFFNAGDLGRTAFFGIGNETGFDKKLEDADYYKTNVQFIRFQPTISFNMSKSLMFQFGGLYEYSNTRETANNILEQIKPYGIGVRSTLAVTAHCSFDSRDIPIAPSKGIFVNLGGMFYPTVFTNDFEFGKASADLRAYIPATILADVVVAFHAGGEKTFGTYPFYKASSIGGVSTLRGFARDRFAGDASLFGQTELRAELGRINLFVPGRLGVSFFGDVGRVYVQGERSRQWHSALGGGLWLNTMNMFVLNVSAAGSAEGMRFYVTSGFAF